MMKGCRLLLGVLILTAVCAAQAPPRTPTAQSALFAFYSDPDFNLNDALITAGDARVKHKAELFHSGPETACFDKLDLSVRAAWDSAVDYYGKVISSAGSNSWQRYSVRVHLLGRDQDLKDARSQRLVELTDKFRTAARPAYQACRWAAQDQKNHEWVEALKPRLLANEQAIIRRLEQLYQKTWAPPIPVDVVATVDWSGANTILDDNPGAGHILISTDYEGPVALEAVFHEASHILMDRKDPFRSSLEKAAKDASVTLPGDLWHVVQFYTTGEVVRQRLQETEHTAYTPMLYGIFERGDWKQYREPLENAWLPYVNGKTSLAQASAALMQSLRPKGSP